MDELEKAATKGGRETAERLLSLYGPEIANRILKFSKDTCFRAAEEFDDVLHDEKGMEIVVDALKEAMICAEKFLEFMRKEDK